MAQDKQQNLWQQVVQKVLPSELNIKAITEKEWDEKYKNLFRQLAEEGFPLVTYDNYKSSDYYAYSYTVISSLRKMSKRKVFNMMVKARKDIKSQYGAQHSLFNIVHSSFESKKKAAKRNNTPLGSLNKSKDEQPRRTFREMMRASGNAFKAKMSEWSKKPIVAKPVRAVKRYGLAVLMFVSSLGSMKVSAETDARSYLHAKQRVATTMTPRKNATNQVMQTKKTAPIKNFSGIYNGLRIDSLHKMMPENVGMVFMSSNKVNATVGGQSITTAKEFGPMLTKMSDLKDFFAANSDQYKDIQKVIAKHGINSKEFEKVWTQNYSPELMHSIVKHLWPKKYQPTFDKLAEAGFSKVTLDTYANPENFGFSAAVISTLGQTSSKTTVDIMLQARQEAEAQYGKKATLDQIVDASYGIKHDKWGLKTRYFGKGESKGELALNQDARQAVKEHQAMNLAQTQNSERNRTIQTQELEMMTEIGDESMETIVNEALNVQAGVRESTAVPSADSLYMQEVQIMMNEDDTLDIQRRVDMLSQKKDTVDIQPDVPFEADVMSVDSWMQAQKLLQSYDIDFNDTISLEMGRVRLMEEQARLQAELDQMSVGHYKGLTLNFGDLEPENAGHVYESLLDPTIKDAKSIYNTNAMGLYQFNMSNTMKLLANALADEFPDLKAAKDKHKGGCRNADYERAWVKYSTGPNHKQFEKRQFEFMFDNFYKQVFANLTERCGAPEIKNADDCKKYWAYTASTMSLINQNPARSTGMMEKAVMQTIAKEAQTAENKKEMAVIRDLLYGRNHTAQDRKRGRAMLKDYIAAHQPNWASVAAASYDVRAAQWRYLSSRYLGNRHDKGEKDLVMKVDRFLREAPALTQRLSQVSDLLQTVELAQNRVVSPFLFLAEAHNLRECEAVKVDAAKVAKIDQLVVLEKRAGNMKELKQTRAKRVSLQKTLGAAADNGGQEQAAVKTSKATRRGTQSQNSDDQYV